MHASRVNAKDSTLPHKPVLAAGWPFLRRIGSQIEAGTVWLNEVHQYSPHQAFGGHKESGLGCENSLHGLMQYTNWQTITLNKGAQQDAKQNAA